MASTAGESAPLMRLPARFDEVEKADEEGLPLEGLLRDERSNTRTGGDAAALSLPGSALAHRQNHLVETSEPWRPGRVEARETRWTRRLKPGILRRLP